jgi:hypothetical protein
MGSYNKDKFSSKFNPKKYELEKSQSSELRVLIEKHKSAGTLGSSAFYDQRMEMRKKHFRNFIELAINSLTGSILHKTKIDEEDKNAFEKELSEISTSFIEREINSLKAVMVSYGNLIDSTIVMESAKAYEKQLTAVKIDTIKLLAVKIEKHNNGEFGSGNTRKESSWKKYRALIIMGFIIAVICVIVLYFIL